ncbi:MAG: hypothetical protein QNJ54_25560 [Prochloraceae cyanobacterium]|nr:hypothetical protein [Prochloraceae cyanobacterium]
MQATIALYQDLAAELNKALEDGEIDDREAAILIPKMEKIRSSLEEMGLEDEDTANAIDLSELEEAVARAYEDGEIDDEEAELLSQKFESTLANYSSGNESIITFSEASEEIGSEMGGALLELGEMLGYEDAGEFITDVAAEMNSPVTYVAQIIRGENLPDPYFAQDLVQILMERQAVSQDEAEDLLLDLVDCGNVDYKRAEEMALVTGESERTPDTLPKDEFKSREREYFESLLSHIDDRQRMQQSSISQEVNEVRYSLGQLQENIQFQQDYENLATAFEEQRQRAEKLVSNGVLTPNNYEYYFGNREVYPDKYKLIEAFARKAEKESTSLVSEFNINERILADLEDKNSEVMQNFYAAGSSTVQFNEQESQQRSDYSVDPYIYGMLERNYPEYARNYANNGKEGHN